MDFTVYLPDELGVRAKEFERGVLSALLRKAVIDELHRRESMSATLTETSEYLLDVTDEDGEPYTARIIGRRIVVEEPKEVFVTEDKRLVVYDAAYNGGEVWVLGIPEVELRQHVSPGTYTEAMRAIGAKPVIDV